MGLVSSVILSQRSDEILLVLVPRQDLCTTHLPHLASNPPRPPPSLLEDVSLASFAIIILLIIGPWSRRSLLSHACRHPCSCHPPLAVTCILCTRTVLTVPYLYRDFI